LHELVLEGVPLSATQINVFRESGEVLEAPPARAGGSDHLRMHAGPAQRAHRRD
jgi:hypothetical protein